MLEELQEIKLLVTYLDFKKTSNMGETLKYFQLSSSRNNETKIQGFRMAVLKECYVSFKLGSVALLLSWSRKNSSFSSSLSLKLAQRE